jgi:hypothetical protein
MSQALQALTPNRNHFKSSHRPQTATLVLPADLADALNEMCTLSAYTDDFTLSDDMNVACRYIADRSGSAAIAACLALANTRERAVVQR